MTLVLLLAGDPAESAQLLQPSNLRLVGGYRIPGENAVGFIKGGLAIDTTPGSERVWIDSHHNKVMEYSLPPLGQGGDAARWPLAAKTSEYTVGQLGLTDTQIEGLLYDPQDQRLYVSGRSGYFVPPKDPAHWLSYLQFPDQTAHALTVAPSPEHGAVMNRYGGGMTLIPPDFAPHVGGRRLAFSSGGYKSGQASTAGPTLAAFDPAEGPITPQPLLNFGDFGTKDKSRVERRTPNYNTGDLWFNQPDGDVGYWQADSVYGGAAWIDHPQYKGVAFQSLQGLGTLEYKRQSETFGDGNQYAFYVYDPEELAAGPAEAVRGKYYQWDSQGVPGVPRGMAWSGDLLWVCYAQALKSGLEWYPVVAAYELVDPAANAPLVDSGGFEAASGYSSTFLTTGQLEGQTAARPWQRTDGRGSTAVIQDRVAGDGAQAVQVDRHPGSDARWAIPLAEPPAQPVLVIDFDMQVEQTSGAAGSFGPFFGSEAYGEASAGSEAALFGSLGVDATTGDILYQAESTGYLTETGVTARFGVWNSYRMVLDLQSNKYHVYVNGKLLATTGFVDEALGLDHLTDADISTFAAASDSQSQSLAGRAYFDNFLVRGFSSLAAVPPQKLLPEPSALLLSSLGAIALLRVSRRDGPCRTGKSRGRQMARADREAFPGRTA